MSDMMHDEDVLRHRFSRRALLLAGTETIGFTLLGWRLFDLQVRGAPHYVPLAEENRANVQILVPRRGRLLDTMGRPLADSDEIFRVTVTPSLAKDVAAVLAKVRRIVPLTDDDIAKIVIRAKKQGRNVPTVIAADLTFDEVAKLNVLAPGLPGIQTEVSWKRRYHGGAAIGHVVGFVGNVENAAAEEDAVLRLPGARVGKTGAEVGFESDLRGAGGVRKIEVDVHGRVVRDLEKVDAIAGRDVSLAIDLDLQVAAMSRLQSERLAAAVVLDVASGEIAVMASEPGFDPGTIAGGISLTNWQKLSTDEDKPLLNRAVAGQYPPGSTFKIVTALAALEAGVVSPNERVACPGHYELDGQSFPCWKEMGHGEISLKDALAASCDVFFFEMARRVGIAKIADTARRLGLGSAYAFGLADEKAGLIPDPDWKRATHGAGWLGGDTLLAGVGQGSVLATPLQLAVMTARLASGRALVPTLLKRDAQAPKPEFPALDFDPAHLALIRQGMLGAVNDEDGTGSAARLGSARPAVAGKTGSAEVSNLTSETSEDGIAWGKRDHALFVAYTPAEAPRYAVSTVIEHGGGGPTAAALARDVLTLVLDRDQRAHPPAPTKSTIDGAG